MAPAQLVVFMEKQAGECMTRSPLEERNWSLTGPVPWALVVKGQSVLSGTWWTLCFCFAGWISWKYRLAKKGLLLVVRALVVKGQSMVWRTWTLRPDNVVEPVHHQNRTKRGSRAQLPTMGSTCLHWSLSSFLQNYSQPWNTSPGWFPPKQEWWPCGP